MSELLNKIKIMQSAVFIALEEHVARDISETLGLAHDEIQNLKKEKELLIQKDPKTKKLVEALGNIKSVTLRELKTQPEYWGNKINEEARKALEEWNKVE